MTPSPSPVLDVVSRPTSATMKHLSRLRKHRKLLKDGSGGEVWPESIEEVFIQGLHEYWQSPWAMYSQSKGRSKWRNQFLVEYLAKRGIVRTKKQVASHIQVLRNMWKGEPEFHLVAGGEEFFDIHGKLDDKDHLSHAAYKFDDDTDSPSPSQSSSNSPRHIKSEFPPSPQLALYPLESHSASSLQGALPPDTIHSSSYPALGFSAHSSNHGDFDGPLQAPNPLRQSPLRDASITYPASSAILSSPSSSQSTSSLVRQQSNFVTALSNAVPANTQFSYYPLNAITSLCLMAEGMTTFTVNVETLRSMLPTSTPNAPLQIQVRLSVPAFDDMRSPMRFEGFIGTVTLSNSWSSPARCLTRRYNGATCADEECDTIEASRPHMGGVVAHLPHSSLTRCRYIEATRITQEIIVDQETLCLIIYEIDRKSSSGMPTAELGGYNPLIASSSKLQQVSRPFETFSSYPYYSQVQPCPRRATQSTYPCIPPSSNGIRHTVPTSMQC
ncbi:hypothetical protein AX16_003646 [Volvariella volvacea WC 439]|nr:hypothetical protein AX16_003646 [Volvariella volvacea WC 439]